MQSAIRSRHVNAAIRRTPQSAMRNMNNRFRRSELELRGPNSVLKIGPRRSRGVCSAPLFVESRNPLPNRAIE
eukprot:10039674-Alexandrium_andersonii.AAC.1